MPAPFYNRKSLRADFDNYSDGAYFVTICTQEKKHYFGRIANEQMHFSQLGLQAYQLLDDLHKHYPYIEMLTFVVMPNHIHAVLAIDGKNAKKPVTRGTLGVVIGGFKQSVTMYARRNGIRFAWQKGYHDHIIRGNDDGKMIMNYVDTNIVRWDWDCYKKGE